MLTMRPAGIVVLAYCLAAAVALAEEPVSHRQPPPLYENLGRHHHPITTSNPQAQRYFDQGLLFAFAFNQGAAVRSFLQAARLDPDCALCYWGVALALGPTINEPMSPDKAALAYASLQMAQERAKAGEIEQAYIAALTTRYAQDPETDRHALDVAYANAMRDLSRRYPDDLDAAVLFAEALMDTSPWQYWLPDGQPAPITEELLAVLESILAKAPNHPQALHLYIHAMEHGPRPEKAEAAAERIAAVAPGAGHLVHMASHIYLRLGRYADAATVNERAVKADEALLADAGRYGTYQASYYPHHVDFLWQAASLSGRGDQAVAAAWKLEATVPMEKAEASMQFDRMLTAPFFALVQFGRWNEILAEPVRPSQPAAQRALWHAARGLAYAAKGQTRAAVAERRNLDRLQSQELPPMHGTSQTKALIALARFVLAGEIDARQGRLEAMRGQYLVAMTLEEQLPKGELRPSYLPVRYLFGSALLRAGDSRGAEVIFRDDLARHPGNGWALSGLLKSLKMSGAGEEVSEVARQLAVAWPDRR
jgi:tetratricopeptide (TPR) repeat protein